MRTIAIYGAGGFGREVALMIRQINAAGGSWNLIGFFDDGKPAGSQIDGLPLMGGAEAINAYPDELALVAAVADPGARQAMVKRVTNGRISFPVIAHPPANPGSEAFNKIGRGCVIAAGSILTTGITLGEFVQVNLHCSIGHDARIGAFTTLLPGAGVSGGSSLGAGCMLGTGARMLQNLSLGDDVVVGAAALVTRSFPGAVTLVGIPATVREKKRS